MKTPREILLERHQAAGSKLDAIRREVVAELNHPEAREQSRPASLVSWLLGGPNKLWLELVWPCRRVWTGLAAVWILLVIVNVSQRDDSPAGGSKSSPSAGMMMAYRDQEKILAELLADRSRPKESNPPRNTAPEPRSETSGTVAL